MKTIVILALIVAVVCALDLTSMAPATTRELSDNHIQVEHHHEHDFVDQTTGRRIKTKLHAVADYHKQWQFVDLQQYTSSAPLSMRCLKASAKRTTISLTANSEADKETVLKLVQVPHTIIKATGLRCGARAVLAHFAAAQTTDGSLTIELTLRQVQLEGLFRNAHVTMSTNHIHHHSFTPEEADALLQAANEKNGITPSAHREMNEQGWFHKIVHKVEHAAHTVVKKAESVVKKAYNDVKNTAEDIGHDIEHIAQQAMNVVDEAEGLLAEAEKTLKFIVALAEGDISADKAWTLAAAQWGTQSLFNSYFTPVPGPNQVTEDYAGMFDLKVVLDLHIQHYSLKLLKVALSGEAKAAVAASGHGKYSKKISKEIADIRLGSINFAIGPVPVHIQPYIPVVFALDIESEATLQFGAQAIGTIEYGFQYTGGKFSPIHSHTFTFNKKFSVPTATLAVTTSITPSLVLNIDFLGGPIASLRIVAAMNLVDEDKLVFTMQPVVLLSAALELRIEGLTLLGPKTFGPYTIDGTVYNIGTIKLPHKLGQREFKLLELPSTTVGDAEPEPGLGTTWRGQSTPSDDCPYHTQLTMQIAGGTSNSLQMMTVIYTALPKADGTTDSTTVIAEYNMTEIGDNLFKLVPLHEGALISSTSAEFPDIAPILFATTTDSGLKITDQIGGAQICNADEPGTMMMSSAAVSQTPAIQSSPNKTNVWLYAAIGGGSLFLVGSVLAAFIVLRTRTQRRQVPQGPAMDEVPSVSEPLQCVA